VVTREHVDSDALGSQTIKESCAPGTPNLKIDELAPVDHVTQVDDGGDVVFFYVREKDVLKKSVKKFIDMRVFTTGPEVRIIDQGDLHAMPPHLVGPNLSSSSCFIRSSIAAKRASSSVGSN
jgi:hypothetical protein